MLRVMPLYCSEACITCAAARCTPAGSMSSWPTMLMRTLCLRISSPSCGRHRDLSAVGVRLPSDALRRLSVQRKSGSRSSWPTMLLRTLCLV